MFVDDLEVDVPKIYDKDIHVLICIVLKSLSQPLVLLWVA